MVLRPLHHSRSHGAANAEHAHPPRRRRGAKAHATSDDKQQEQRQQLVDAGGASTALSPLTAPGKDIVGPSTNLAVIYDRFYKVCDAAGRVYKVEASPRSGLKIPCVSTAPQTHFGIPNHRAVASIHSITNKLYGTVFSSVGIRSTEIAVQAPMAAAWFPKAFVRMWAHGCKQTKQSTRDPSGTACCTDRSRYSPAAAVAAHSGSQAT